MADKMDKETKEILEEMEADGIDTSTIRNGEKIDKALDEPAEEAEQSDEPEEEEADEEDEETEEEESDDETEDDDSEDSEEEEGDEDEDKSKKLSIVQKYRRERKLRKEAENALGELQKAKGDEDFDQQLKAFVAKSGMNEDVARQFLDLAAKRAGLPKEFLEEMKRSQRERRNTDHWSDQHKQFDADFKNNVTPVLESLGKSKDDIKAIYQTLNEDKKSPAWAWNPTNKKTSLVKLALGLARGKTDRTSSEGNAGRAMNRGKTSKSVDEMDGEDIENMSDDEFDTFSDKLAKDNKSTLHRS